MTENITEEWRPAEMQRREAVHLSGPDAVVYVVGGQRWDGTKVVRPWTKFHVTYVSVTTRWPVSDPDAGKRRVGIMAYRDGRKPADSIELKPGQLREIPDWLSDVALRATPRDVDFEDMKPFQGS